MATTKHYTKKEVQEFFEEFKKEKSKYTKTDVSIELMDAYVAIFHPTDIERWIDTCLSYPMIELKSKNGELMKDDDGNPMERKDVARIREFFLQNYFRSKSEKGIKEAKEEARKKKEQKKQEKEALEKMTPEERLRAKMEKYLQESKNTDE